MYFPILLLVFLSAGIPCHGFGATSESENQGVDANQGVDDGDVDFFDKIVEINRLGTEAETFSSDERIKETLIEGDIVVTPKLMEDMGMMRRGGDTGISMFEAIKRGAWPGARVPYTYNSDREQRNLQPKVNQAVREYNTKTCIKWVHYDRTAIQQFKYYVTFFQGGGCYSMIGRQSRPQKISLQYPGCTYQVGTVIHEMMHALGFYHEQSRLDRDNYIYINFANINRRMWYNFQKYRPGDADTLGEPYDKTSVMHYGSKAFSINGRKTIISKSNANERLGQRKGLSVIDVKQLQKYYSCKTTTTVPTTNEDCKDNYPFCGLLKTICDHKWVKKNCKEICDECIKMNPCVDKQKYCPGWKGAGFCNSSNKYYNYMMNNCAKTCETAAKAEGKCG